MKLCLFLTLLLVSFELSKAQENATTVADTATATTTPSSTTVTGNSTGVVNGTSTSTNSTNSVLVRDRWSFREE